MTTETSVSVTVISNGVEVPTLFDLTNEFTAIVPINTVLFVKHELSHLLVDNRGPVHASHFVDKKSPERWVIHKPIEGGPKEIEIKYVPEVNMYNLIGISFFKEESVREHTFGEVVSVIKHLVGSGFDRKYITSLSGKNEMWIYKHYRLINLVPELLELVSLPSDGNGRESVLPRSTAQLLQCLKPENQIETWERIKGMRTPKRDQELNRILVVKLPKSPPIKIDRPLLKKSLPIVAKRTEERSSPAPAINLELVKAALKKMEAKKPKMVSKTPPEPVEFKGFSDEDFNRTSWSFEDRPTG